MFANKDVSTTYHEWKCGKKYAVTVNYSDKEYAYDYKSNGVKVKTILYGDDKKIAPYDAIVAELE